MIGERQAVENARFGSRIHYLNRGDDKSVIVFMDFLHFNNSVETKYSVRMHLDG